jgi:hypothetical protein
MLRTPRRSKTRERLSPFEVELSCLSPRIEAELWTIFKRETDFLIAVRLPVNGPEVALAVCRERVHRRLATQTYQEKCLGCIWGCRMPVEMIIGVESESAPPSVTVLVLARCTKRDRRARFLDAAVE